MGGCDAGTDEAEFWQELTTAEGDLRTLVATLAQQLQNATVKHADDVVCEVDFATDSMTELAPDRFKDFWR